MFLANWHCKMLSLQKKKYKTNMRLQNPPPKPLEQVNKHLLGKLFTCTDKLVKVWKQSKAGIESTRRLPYMYMYIYIYTYFMTLKFDCNSCAKNVT